MRAFTRLFLMFTLTHVAACGDDDKTTRGTGVTTCPAGDIADVIAAKPKPRPPQPVRVSITSLTPDRGGEGALFTIEGPDFGSRNRPGAVFFDDVTATVYSWGPTQVVSAVPAGFVADVYGVRVNVPNRGFSNSVSFAVQPVITALVPLEAAAGDTITVTGTWFGATQGVLLVDCAPVRPAAWSPTAITFTVPQLANAVTASVVVQVNDIASEPASFRYIGGAQPQDTWYPMAVTGIDPNGALAFWTGAEMLVFSGAPSFEAPQGGVYNPVTDEWRPINMTGAPSFTLVGVWAPERRELIVTSHDGVTARYDLQTDQWFAASTTGPIGPSSVVWTGTEMIAWGSADADVFSNTGARYNPSTDQWAAMTTEAAPAWRVGNGAVWTGEKMLIWGGELAGNSLTNTGGLYDPVANSWAPTATDAAPVPRANFSTVWTGSEMIVWGGRPQGSGTGLATGGRYNPDTDAWQATSLTGAPQARIDHAAVWTGSVMIVWGGESPLQFGTATYEPDGTSVNTFLNSGAKYAPATDTWQATSLIGAPERRSRALGVWDGVEMIVWGGHGFFAPVPATGGRYRP